MGTEPLQKALHKLDANPPRLRWSDARSDAFLEIGRFLEATVRPDGEYDLRAVRPNPVWQVVEPRLRNAASGAARAEPAGDRLLLWQMYNSGALLKSGGLVIGLDVVPMPRFFGWEETAGLTDELADVIDLLLLSHDHEDHYDRPLVRALLDRGKPVVLPEHLLAEWHGRDVRGAADGGAMELSGVRILPRTGLHAWRQTAEETPLVCYEVVLPNGFTFVFGGDVDYTKRLEKSPGARVDLFFLPWRNPNEKYEDGHPSQIGITRDAVEIALGRLQPGAMLYEHCAELDHVYGTYGYFPASFDIALELKLSVPTPSELMFWGEKIELPVPPPEAGGAA